MCFGSSGRHRRSSAHDRSVCPPLRRLPHAFFPLCGGLLARPERTGPSTVAPAHPRFVRPSAQSCRWHGDNGKMRRTAAASCAAPAAADHAFALEIVMRILARSCLLALLGALLVCGCALRNPRDSYAYGRVADGLWDADYDLLLDWNYPTSANQGRLEAPKRFRPERPAIGVPWAA